MTTETWTWFVGHVLGFGDAAFQARAASVEDIMARPCLVRWVTALRFAQVGPDVKMAVGKWPISGGKMVYEGTLQLAPSAIILAGEPEIKLVESLEQLWNPSPILKANAMALNPVPGGNNRLTPHDP